MASLRGNPWAILSVLSLAYFMSQLDIAVLTVAIPAMAEHLNASLDQIVWSMSAYVFALAVTLTTAGRLGDLYGRRKIFLIGVTVFTVFSLGGGLAQNAGELIAARALQGLGAALLVPQTMALLVEVFPADRRGMALGVRGAVGGLAAVLGPVVGGLLVTALDWRWVFLVNVPVGVAMLVLAALVMPEVRHRGNPRLDVPGVALLSAALFCFAFAVSQGERYRWQGFIWVLLVFSGLLFAGFLLHQRRIQDREPLLPFELFRDRNYSLMNAFSVSISITIIGLILILSVFFQSVLGFSALKAGLVIMPASLFSMALDPVAGRLADKVEGKYLLFFGAALTVVGMLWAMAVMREGADWQTFVAPMCVIGIGNAFLFTPLAAVALHGVRAPMAGAASGVLVTTLQIGSMVGTAVTGALLRVTGSSTPTVDTSRTAMTVLAVVAALGAAICLAARPTAPARETAEAVPPDSLPGTADSSTGGAAGRS